MGIVKKTYRENFLKRYDKDEGIPYYAPGDFPGLCCEEGNFTNSAGVTIRYFTYSYEGYEEGKLILFCPGMGPGHAAYLAEIEKLCRAGHRVLTLDYTGCGTSGGERMPSINAPTRDAVELLELLHPEEEIIPVGHSLGGYTVLNLAHLLPGVRRAVVLSGFVGIADVMVGYLKLRLLADIPRRYEKKLDPKYGAIDNRKYLKETRDKILWIHSGDDPVVNYKHNAGWVEEIRNPNIKVIRVEGKKHNPQYAAEALTAMNAWIGEYYRLIREKKLGTAEEKRAFFADKPIAKMTGQDPAVYEEIERWIAGKVE